MFVNNILLLLKKSLLPFLIIISCSTAFSQTGPSFTRLFDNLFVNISMADATTGLVYDRVVPFANLPALNSRRNPNGHYECKILLPGFRPCGTWECTMYDVRFATYEKSLRSPVYDTIANRKSHLARHNPKITYLCRVIVFGYDGKRI